MKRLFLCLAFILLLISPTLSSEDKVIELVGDIHGMVEIEVYSRVSGLVRDIYKLEGVDVNTGDTLLLIDRDLIEEYMVALVESPIRGTVIKHYVQIGTFVTPLKPISLIAKIDQIKIIAQVSEADLPYIKLGQEVSVKVDAYGDKVFKGKLSKISPVVDRDTGKIEIEVIVDNFNRLLKIGMIAKIEL